jgi:hypothetical protein
MPKIAAGADKSYFKKLFILPENTGILFTVLQVRINHTGL